ncbi:MAG: MFS transporter [Chlamydiota bacterium]
MTNRVKGWLICLIASCFFSYELVQLHMLNAISPMLMKDLSLSTTDFSALCSTYLLADVIFLIPAGIILDRVPVRKIILMALGLCIIGTFGFAFSTTFMQAAVSHFLSGIGNAFCFLSCMMLANSWFGKKSSLIMSVMITIALLGGVIAQVPFALLAEKFSWQKTLIFDGIVGCLIWVLNYIFVEENKANALIREKSSVRVFLSNLKPAFSNIQVWKCGFYTGFLNLPLMIISAMIGNLYLTQVLHFNLLQASLITSMISVGTIVGSPLYGFLSDFFQKKKMLMMAGALLSLAGFSMLLIVKSPSLFTMMTIFFSLGFFSASQVLGYPMITDLAPKELRGTSMGLAALIIMGLAFVGQPLTGFLIDMTSTADSYNFTYALMIFPIGFIVSLVMALSIKEPTYVLALENE